MKAIKLPPSAIVVFLILLLISCSKESVLEEPDDPSSFSTEEGLIKPEILHGIWVLESSTDVESGKTTHFNDVFSILPFNVKQESDYIVKDKYGINNVWAEIYETFTSAITVNDVIANYGIVGFMNKVGKPLKDAMVYEVCFTIPRDNGFIVLVGVDFSYKDGILICQGSCEFTQMLPSIVLPTNRKVNTIKLRKLS